jgi:hypothetical protein
MIPILKEKEKTLAPPGSRERRHTERDREEIRLERVCEREDKDMNVNRIES